MQIAILSTTGDGPTGLAAFDDALLRAGIANYNLIRLSSVIPPGSALVETDGSGLELPGKWGDRLYIVSAEAIAETPGQEAWAGIGWAQDPETGKGLFVEHHADNEQRVRDDIKASLDALLRSRGLDLPVECKVIGRTCKDQPVCALVAAVYEVAGWGEVSSRQISVRQAVQAFRRPATRS